MHRLTVLKTRCYLGIGLVFSVLNIVTEWMKLFSGNVSSPVVGFFTSVFWTVFSIIAVCGYPWVRINILGDLDHPIRVFKKYDQKAEQHWQDARDAYSNAPNEYKTTFYVRDHGVDAYTYTDDRLKKQAETPHQMKAMGTQYVGLGVGLLMYFVDAIIWFVSPVLIWFSLGKRTFTKAANLGYLKPQYYNGEY